METSNNTNDFQRNALLFDKLYSRDEKPFNNVDQKHAYGYYWVYKIFPEWVEELWQYKEYDWEISERACLLCYKWKKEYKSKNDRCN